MKKHQKYLFFLGALIFVFCFAGQALADGNDCRCYSDLGSLKDADYQDQSKIFISTCLPAAQNQCFTKILTADQQKATAVTCARATDSKGNGDASICDTNTKAWKDDYAKKLQTLNLTGVGAHGSVSTAQSSLSQFIIDCGQPGKLANWSNKKCSDITIFIYLLLDLVKYLFNIIGAISLGVFVYGGFVLVLSQGNQEKVQAGTGAMVNAVIGMFISFAAYVIVGFVAQALGVTAAFTLF